MVCVKWANRFYFQINAERAPEEIFKDVEASIDALLAAKAWASARITIESKTKDSILSAKLAL